MQSYVMSGDFTVKGKLVQSAKENAIFYAIIAVISVVVFAVLWAVVGIENLCVHAHLSPLLILP